MGHFLFFLPREDVFVTVQKAQVKTIKLTLAEIHLAALVSWSCHCSGWLTVTVEQNRSNQLLLFGTSVISLQKQVKINVVEEARC